MAIDLFDETMGLLAELERHGVPYAVAGALALAIHGVLEVARARGFRVQALPMRFSDGLEVRRSSKVDATVMLTLDLLLVNENLEPVWASRERGPVTPPEMSAHAVTSRLREASARSDLTASRRLLTKVDMSPAAVTMRLRVQSALRDACLAWARRRPASRT